MLIYYNWSLSAAATSWHHRCVPAIQRKFCIYTTTTATATATAAAAAAATGTATATATATATTTTNVCEQELRIFT